MKVANLTMRVCLERKRISLPRLLIQSLGNPSHLNFWFGDGGDSLIISPASKDELYAYEIPQYYWRNANQGCEVARIAFLLALQQGMNWEKGGRYIFYGVMKESEGIPAAVFNLTEGMRLR